MENKIQHKMSFKLTLLCSSFLLIGSALVAAILPNLQVEFPNVSKEGIQTFISITSFSQIFAVILAGLLANHIGKRRLMLIACVLFTIGGIVPMFLNNFTLILIMRLVEGAGIGLAQPISSSIIIDCYEGKERDNMMGFQSSFLGAGGSILTYIVSYLIVFNWKYAYLIYLVGMLLFVLIFFNIKDIDNKVKTKENSTKKLEISKKVKLPVSSYIFGLFAGIFTMLVGCVYINLAMAAVESGHGNDSAHLFVAFSVATFIAGIAFGNAAQIFKRYIGVVSILLAAIGWIIIGNTSNLGVMYIGVLMGGLGFVWYKPYIILKVNKKTTSQTSAKPTATIFAGSAIAGVIAPYVLGGIGRILGNTTSKFSFVICGIGLLVLVIVDIIYEFKSTEEVEIIHGKHTALNKDFNH